MERFITAEPFPPGEYLKEELDARGWTQNDLAQVLGMTPRHVANLIAGKSALTAGTAILIGKAFDQDPKTWMEFQITYELALAAQQDRDVAKRSAIFNKVPLAELKKRCWLPDTDDPDKLQTAICKLLRIEKIEDEPNFAVAARKGTTYAYENAAQIAWYARVRQLAEGAPAGTYREEQLEVGIRELLALAQNPEDARRIPKHLGEMGIRLVLCQHLSKSKIEGAAFWLDDKSPVIALSMRYDRIDNLWFNILHEAVHIKYRHVPHVDVEADESSEASNELPEHEQIANSEAAEYLVPKAKLDSFIRRTAPFFYLDRVVQFARAQGVHPGIVVGQLHKRKALKPFQLRKRNILVEVRQHILGQAITDGWGNDIWLD